MLYYILPYFILLGISTLSFFLILKKLERIVVFFIAFIPAILLVILRGNVGTDTNNYLSFFKDLRLDKDPFGFEPGFEFLGRFINFFGLDERTNLALVSLITILILYKSFSAKKESILLFSALIFPIFFYDMTMNGIRYGLSFSIACLAVDSLYKKNNILFGILSVLSMSIQYSGFFIIFVFFILKLDKKALIGFVVLVVAIIPFVGKFISNNLEYLYDKQDFYKDVASPGATSGLAPLALFLVIFGSFFFYSPKSRSNNVLLLILLLELIAFSIARVSYAGLRFQMLFLFSLILLIKEEFNIVVKKKEYLCCLTLIGIFGFLFTLKNLSAVVEGVETPFIPYKFFWQEN